MTPAPPSLEAQRQAAQLAFLASGAEIEIGRAADCPLPVEALAAVRGDEPWVRQAFDGGLTARVFRVHAGGRDWTLKKARAQALVHNVDGRTSFLNELQRRAELRALKAAPGGERRFAGIVDTQYASLRRGILLSPWIAGEPVWDWDARRLEQVLAQLVELHLAGLFEWDPSPGNVLDDGRRLMLFDFGYLYRFDPRRHFNSAGDGRSEPRFHPAERFETRNLSAVLLALEQGAGQDAALALFRLEKELALQAYRRLGHELAAVGAEPDVVAWIERIADGWAQALRGDPGALYLAENWRSHVLDLEDDLGGRSCTPVTLARADWLLAALERHFGDLQAQDAFFGADRGRPRAELDLTYRHKKRMAEELHL